MHGCKRTYHGVFISALLFVGAGFFMPGSAVALSGVTAKGALVQRLDTGTVAVQRNSVEARRAASTVKILTAIIAVQELKLDDEAVISKRAACIAPSKAYLTRGAKYKVRDLLKAFLMGSANDAGVALAEAVSGTEIKFSQLMNKRARQMGAKHSKFLNATGLPEGKKWQGASPQDLAIFMKKFSEYPFLMDVLSRKKAVIQGSDGKKISIKNHNKLLWREGNTLIGKTGYTRRAGQCFLGIFKKDGRQYIVVMQGGSKLWGDLKVLMKSSGR
jgi:D-alanyl-D-alanine carboxypeptidase